MAWFNDLPRELEIDILVRLPVKTLVRFMCLAKSWRSSVTHPTFIALYLQHGRGNSSSYFIHIPNVFRGKRLCTVIHDQTISDEELPFKTHSGRYYLVGACNGLLCLSGVCWNRFSDFLYIWNPSLRKFKIIRCSCLEHGFDKKGHVITMVGFGFDHRANDFLVIRFVYFLHQYEKMSYTEVYSLNTDSWSRVESVLPCLPDLFFTGWAETEFLWPHPRCNRQTTFLNGVVHWNASRTGNDEKLYSIVSFDIAEQQFRMIELPGDCFGCFAEPPDYWTPAVFEESLAFIVHGKAGDEEHSKVCYIWVMKEYGVFESWIKQFTIQLEDTVTRAFGFTKNGELLLHVGGELISCNVDSGEYKDLGFCFGANSYDASTCMESLCLLERENAVLETA